ncbi:MAG TPA: 5-formyltetrahydrofolate cyclo-ligase [Candidatus Eisenbergiella stercoravium]|nr:5-formyltetrahydrofolate cyclo-ligase [Candidatus Eisenbergiella stercoravium]
MLSERNVERQDGRLLQGERKAIKLQKTEQRREGLKRRSELTGEERAHAEERIRSVLIALPWYRNAGRLLLYVSYGNEVPTRRLMEEALAAGKQVFCPRVEGAGSMSFYRIDGPEELSPGFRGIPEPPAQEWRKYRIQPLPEGKSDLIVMPGAAFDRNLGRLGYGGGYYDRFLQALEEAGSARLCAGKAFRKIAVGFSCQILDSLAQEPEDVRPDLIVTEREIIGLTEGTGTTETVYP